MEFDELQKVWDAQNTRRLYVLDEKALHGRIQAKRSKADFTANFTEWLVILTNLLAGGTILALQFINDKASLWMFLLSAWMFGIAAFVLVSRTRRVRENNAYDRSIRGDLNYAIGVATYQVQLSKWVRWGIIPIGVLIALGLVQGGNSIWFALVTLCFFGVSYYFSGWEHNYYKARKRELEVLQAKLDGE